jgi:hypothetical protein
VVVEELLQLLVGEVNTQLFETVVLWSWFWLVKLFLMDGELANAFIYTVSIWEIIFSVYL